MRARIFTPFLVVVCASCQPERLPPSGGPPGYYAPPPPPPPPPAPPPTVVLEEEPGVVEPGTEGDEPALPPPRPLTAPPGVGVVGEVDRELSSMRSTAYTHHSRIDESQGAFEYDCSGFVDYALGVSTPAALAELTQATTGRPLARHFVGFFGGLPPTGRGHWAPVPRAIDLQPGDLIAWLRPPEVASKNTGHVMFVHGPVTPYQGRADAFVVPIADSTHAPHGKSDPRSPARASGLGTGNIVLLTDAAGRPIGYKWSTWKKSVEYRTPVAMGRALP